MPEFQLTKAALAQPEAFVSALKQAVEDVEEEESCDSLCIPVRLDGYSGVRDRRSDWPWDHIKAIATKLGGHFQFAAIVSSSLVWRFTIRFGQAAHSLGVNWRCINDRKNSPLTRP